MRSGVGMMDLRNSFHFELERYKKLRIWLNNTPFLMTGIEETRSYSAPTQGIGKSKLTSAAIEMFAPYGPLSFYGLLGARFDHDDSRRLTILLQLTGSDGSLMSDVLKTSHKDVREGLPGEYALGIKDALDGFSLRNPITISGTMTLICAAHSEVSSTNLAFRRVTSALIWLFQTSDGSLDPQTSVNEMTSLLFPQENVV